MADLLDDELLASLRVVLTPLPVRPDDDCIAQLHATLAELAEESSPIEITTFRRRALSGYSLQAGRRRTWRPSLVAASALALTLAATAAAAVVTNTLPGPTRSIAYHLGLPVTSPALYRAEQSTQELRAAIRAKDRPQETKLGSELIKELKSLNSSDLAQIRSTAESLLVEIGLRVPTLPKAPKTPITSTDTIPSVSVPGVTIPPVSVPRVTVPGGSVPSISVPTVTVPHVTVPSVTVPSVSIPSVTLPKVTLPNVTLPSLPSL